MNAAYASKARHEEGSRGFDVFVWIQRRRKSTTVRLSEDELRQRCCSVGDEFQERTVDTNISFEYGHTVLVFDVSLQSVVRRGSSVGQFPNGVQCVARS